MHSQAPRTCCAASAGQQHVDSSSEFAVVVQYQLGDHHILMAAEVDAVKDAGDGPVNGKPYVELKTYKCVILLDA